MIFIFLGKSMRCSSETAISCRLRSCFDFDSSCLDWKHEATSIHSRRENVLILTLCMHAFMQFRHSNDELEIVARSNQPSGIEQNIFLQWASLGFRPNKAILIEFPSGRKLSPVHVKSKTQNFQRNLEFETEKLSKVSLKIDMEKLEAFMIKQRKLSTWTSIDLASLLKLFSLPSAVTMAITNVNDDGNEQVKEMFSSFALIRMIMCINKSVRVLSFEWKFKLDVRISKNEICSGK